MGTGSNEIGTWSIGSCAVWDKPGAVHGSAGALLQGTLWPGMAGMSDDLRGYGPGISNLHFITDYHRLIPDITANRSQKPVHTTMPRVKRLRRIMFNTLTAISLLLALATVGLWVRSLLAGDRVYVHWTRLRDTRFEERSLFLISIGDDSSRNTRGRTPARSVEHRTGATTPKLLTTLVHS